MAEKRGGHMLFGSKQWLAWGGLDLLNLGHQFFDPNDLLLSPSDKVRLYFVSLGSDNPPVTIDLNFPGTEGPYGIPGPASALLIMFGLAGVAGPRKLLNFLLS